jgi:DNA-binding SARP family transcriptional activator
VVTDRLAIQLLGDFRVSVGPRAIAEREWTLRKSKSLVKLLALAPRHRLHREHVSAARSRWLMHVILMKGAS